MTNEPPVCKVSGVASSIVAFWSTMPRPQVWPRRLVTRTCTSRVLIVALRHLMSFPLPVCAPRCKVQYETILPTCRAYEHSVSSEWIPTAWSGTLDIGPSEIGAFFPGGRTVLLTHFLLHYHISSKLISLSERSSFCVAFADATTLCYCQC